MHDFETLVDLIDPGKDRNATVIVDRTGGGRREVSYGELLGRIAAARTRLVRDHQIEPGDSVALLGLNSVEYLAAYFAIMSAGAVAVPVNHTMELGVLQVLLADADVKLALVDDAAQEALQSVPVTIAPMQGIDSEIDDVLDAVACSPESLALMLYTSGSTGRPKGVMLSHKSQVQAIRAFGDQVELLYGLASIVAAPLFHMNALTHVHLMLMAHGQVVLCAQFNAAQFLNAVVEDSVAVVGAVPPMISRLALEASTTGVGPFENVMIVSIGSAPLGEATLAESTSLFPNAVVVNGYGTTEIGPTVFGNHPEGVARPPLSVGYPNPANEVRLVDGPSADQGVLEVRGDSLTMGYKNLEETNKEKFQDGWYRTGDILRRDSDGFYYFVGREDDMFVCNGENVYPMEVETLLERHPKIQQAAVVSLPDASRGAIPVAFVVKADESLDEDEVKAYALEAGPAYRHPRKVYFLETLPLSAVNKVDKLGLTKLAGERH